MFSKNKTNPDGLCRQCKDCVKIANNEYRLKNIEKLNEYNKKYRIGREDKLNEYTRNYRKENKQILAIKDSIRKKNATEEQRQRLRISGSKSGKKNRKKRILYTKNRMKTNINFRLGIILRSRFSKALKGNYKSGSAVKDLGCSISEFKIYIENLFTEGMTWENYGRGVGKWTIDHIYPISKVDLSIREELLKVCHYTNLQPMWFIENCSKRDKIW